MAGVRIQRGRGLTWGEMNQAMGAERAGLHFGEHRLGKGEQRAAEVGAVFEKICQAEG